MVATGRRCVLVVSAVLACLIHVDRCAGWEWDERHVLQEVRQLTFDSLSGYVRYFIFERSGRRVCQVDFLSTRDGAYFEFDKSLPTTYLFVVQGLKHYYRSTIWDNPNARNSTQVLHQLKASEAPRWPLAGFDNRAYSRLEFDWPTDFDTGRPFLIVAHIGGKSAAYMGPFIAEDKRIQKRLFCGPTDDEIDRLAAPVGKPLTADEVGSELQIWRAPTATKWFETPTHKYKIKRENGLTTGFWVFPKLDHDDKIYFPKCLRYVFPFVENVNENQAAGTVTFDLKLVQTGLVGGYPEFVGELIFTDCVGKLAAALEVEVENANVFSDPNGPARTFTFKVPDAEQRMWIDDTARLRRRAFFRLKELRMSNVTETVTCNLRRFYRFFKLWDSLPDKDKAALRAKYPE